MISVLSHQATAGLHAHVQTSLLRPHLKTPFFEDLAAPSRNVMNFVAEKAGEHTSDPELFIHSPLTCPL